MFSTIITGGNEISRNSKADGIRQSLDVSINSPDLIIIDEENSIGIDKVREIKSKTKYAPLSDPNKLIIIKNADKLTPEAQNALLKILEEPPSKTYFLLLAASKKSFLPTILSRCQEINLQASDLAELDEKDYQESIVWNNLIYSTDEKEKIGLTLTTAEKISASSFPSKTGALKFLEKQTIILRKLIPGVGKNISNNLPKLMPSQAIKIIRLIGDCQNQINSNVNVRLCLENLFFKVSEIPKN